MSKHGWYCANCAKGVPGDEVTFREYHTLCGGKVGEWPESHEDKTLIGLPDLPRGHRYEISGSRIIVTMPHPQGERHHRELSEYEQRVFTALFKAAQAREA